MTTITETAPYTKEVLLDKIGEYNVKIVKLEEDIPVLEERASAYSDMPSFAAAASSIQDSLHEKRHELHMLKAHIKALRMALRGRLELEHEAALKKLRETYRSAADLEDLTNHQARLQEEIEKLTKLIEGDGY
jgi:chromosome segregation ATPase